MDNFVFDGFERRKLHPKPQFMREHWRNLNGKWDFCVIDKEQNIRDVSFDKKINVPFCPESELSGVSIKDFMYHVCYRRIITLEKFDLDGNILLHFGAADFKTILYINGKKVGFHFGGYVSFSFDITEFVLPGDNEVIVECFDDTRNDTIPTGKQSTEQNSFGCFYTRTTGIWQTVWLEFMPKIHVKDFKINTEISGKINVQLSLVGTGSLDISVSFKDKIVGSFSKKEASGLTNASIDLSEVHLWEVGVGNLYDIIIKFGEDVVKTYAGIREVHFDGYKFILNGKSVFQRLVLDQGFYPDGIYTAPTDEALLNDIELSMACGFNGARLHQKVFEERFLYYADLKGYMVWGEYPNWGINFVNSMGFLHLMTEWADEINRDYNHPSIIGWCPLNETWSHPDNEYYEFALESIYKLTYELDNTRIFCDTSGGDHVHTEVFDYHDYDQVKDSYNAKFTLFNAEKDVIENFRNPYNCEYKKGQPVFISEYGGILWSREMATNDNIEVENKVDKSWGYGQAVRNSIEYKERYKALTHLLLDNPKLFGFCYTQLTDVEQEQNGVFYYNREKKFDCEFFREVNSKIAAIELTEK